MARHSLAAGISVWRSLALVLCVTIAASAADHQDAPMQFEDGRLDLNDVYAFQSPSDPDNTVLIMTVNPFAGVFSPTTFHPGAAYDFKIDRDGDAVEDLTISVTFDKVAKNGQQSLRVHTTPAVQIRNGNSHRFRSRSDLGGGRTGKNVSLQGGAKVHASLFDDPFFFDIIGFRNGLAFTGDDSFADFNIGAIVLEVPSEWLGDNNIGVWARTAVEEDSDEQGRGKGKHESSRQVQFDRTGLPAINTVLIPRPLKDAFNAGEPRNDQRDFGDVAVATLIALGNDQATAEALASVLLPDIMPIDTSSTAGFLNGRQLADDVIDAELSLVTGGAVTGDGVNANDVPFSATFPYLASPH